MLIQFSSKLLFWQVKVPEAFSCLHSFQVRLCISLPVQFLLCSNGAYSVSLYSFNYYTGCRLYLFQIFIFCCRNVASFFSSTASNLVWYNGILTVQVPTLDLSCRFWILCGCGIFLISSTAVTHMWSQLGRIDPVNTAVFHIQYGFDTHHKHILAVFPASYISLDSGQPKSILFLYITKQLCILLSLFSKLQFLAESKLQYQEKKYFVIKVSSKNYGKCSAILVVLCKQCILYSSLNSFKAMKMDSGQLKYCATLFLSYSNMLCCLL